MIKISTAILCSLLFVQPAVSGGSAPDQGAEPPHKQAKTSSKGAEVKKKGYVRKPERPFTEEFRELVERSPMPKHLREKLMDGDYLKQKKTRERRKLEYIEFTLIDFMERWDWVGLEAEINRVILEQPRVAGEPNEEVVDEILGVFPSNNNVQPMDIGEVQIQSPEEHLDLSDDLTATEERRTETPLLLPQQDNNRLGEMAEGDEGLPAFLVVAESFVRL